MSALAGMHNVYWECVGIPLPQESGDPSYKAFDRINRTMLQPLLFINAAVLVFFAATARAASVATRPPRPTLNDTKFRASIRTRPFLGRQGFEVWFFEPREYLVRCMPSVFPDSGVVGKVYDQWHQLLEL